MNRGLVMPRLLFALLMVFALSPARAGEIVVPPPQQGDKCPVCGMFVAPYPEWVAAVVYKDGHAHYFDGAKDLFRFLQSPTRWAPGHRDADVAGISVTEYYAVRPIDAKPAFYVIGSDVYGPMGRELIPLATEADAAEFVRDHGGKVLRFDAVTADILDGLN